ncbi:MAG: bifunctional tetrahydrofolate synthase/dihydrofolate synthase [Rhodocyclaceae bacterium]|nr:bifunctional tetrahydrofolate synthase/dihydrofolate synthase [Rhodocyclaceae bacterium]
MSAPGADASLADWLVWLEGQQRGAILLGLDRVRRVAEGMGLRPAFPVFTVAGTNGKGSTCALLGAMLSAAGYRVGSYYSPHLLRYNERVRVDGAEASDADLVAGFAAIEAARGEESLTYFEFATLAAMWHFMRAGVDCAVLEVGLGGRLDAVNVWDADCAIVTTIGLDHTEYLGDTREAIALEKAGIYRADRPAICVDPAPPATLLAHAADIGAHSYWINRDFRYVRQERQWAFEGAGLRLSGLPMPALVGEHQLQNAAGVIAALGAMRERLPVPAGAIREGLMNVHLAGRFQVLPGRPMVILDVAHNPHAAAILARNLRAIPPSGHTHAIFSILADKDASGTVAELGDLVDTWWVAGLSGPRGRRAEDLAAEVGRVAQGRMEMAATPVEAWRRLRDRLGENDKVVVFGSFLTVAEVLAEVRA